MALSPLLFLFVVSFSFQKVNTNLIQDTLSPFQFKNRFERRQDFVQSILRQTLPQNSQRFLIEPRRDVAPARHALLESPHSAPVPCSDSCTADNARANNGTETTLPLMVSVAQFPGISLSLLLMMCHGISKSQREKMVLRRKSTALIPNQ